MLDEPQKLDGYVFDGWYTDSHYKKKFSGSFADYTDLSEPLVLYPHYSLAGFSLNWQLNGGTFVADVPDAYTILSDVYLPNNDIVKKQGFALKGWALDGRLVEYFTPSILCDVTLTAVWEPIYYELRYETNGGELDGTEISYTIEDDFLLAEPTRKAYRFDGWYSDKVFTKPMTAIERGNMGDKTVYAKWSPITYTISYNLCGGENSQLNPSVYSAEASVKLLDPTRPGYTFAGWLCGNEEIIELNAAENGNTELTAQWRPNEYTVTVCPNNGENAYVIPVSYDGYYSIPIPSRFGYTFIDYELLTGEVFACVGQYVFDSNIVVTAKYTANQYTITYVYDSKPQYVQTVTHDKAYALLTADGDIGYTFECWVDSNGKTYKGIVYPTKNLYLTPRFKPEEYTVSLDANGGDIFSTTAIVKYEQSYSLPVPTRTGYTFVGWFTGVDSAAIKLTDDKGISLSNWMSASNGTAYAVWTTDYRIDMQRMSCKLDNGYNPNESGNEKDVSAHSPFELVGLYLGGCVANGDGTYYVPKGSTLSLSFQVLENIGSLPTGTHLGSVNWTIHNLCNDSYTGTVCGTNISSTSKIGKGAYYVKITYTNGRITESNKVNFMDGATKGQFITLDLNVNSAWTINSIEVVCVYELYYDYMSHVFDWGGTKCYANWRCESTIKFS